MNTDTPLMTVTSPVGHITPCWLDTCREPSHAVVYASDRRFVGLETRPRQAIGLCLKHGGELLDVMRAWNKQGRPLNRKSVPCPNWLVSDLKNGRMPRMTPDPNGWPSVSPAAVTKFRKGR
jgi:hypothetical protein